MAHERDKVPALWKTAFVEAADAFKTLGVGTDGSNYYAIFVNGDGAVSTHVAREIVATGVVVLTAGSTATIAQRDGRSKILLAHVTSGGPDINVSFQTNQTTNGLTLRYPQRPEFETDEIAYLDNSAGGSTVRVYYIEYGGPA